MAVREHQNITLTCKADGYPLPKLMWKREDGQVISLNKHNKGMSGCQVFSYLPLLRCNVNHSQFTLHVAYRKSIFTRGSLDILRPFELL